MFLASPKSSSLPIAPSPSHKTESGQNEVKSNDKKDPFTNIFDKFISKKKEEEEPWQVPKLLVPKKEDETQNEENNILLNSLFNSSFLLQPQQVQNSKQEGAQFFSFMESQKGVLNLSQNNFLNGMDANNSKLNLDDYKFYGISNLMSPNKNQVDFNTDDKLKSVFPNISADTFLNDLSKNDLVNLSLVKNEDNKINSYDVNDAAVFENLQKGDLVYLSKNINAELNSAMNSTFNAKDLSKVMANLNGSEDKDLNKLNLMQMVKSFDPNINIEIAEDTESKGKNLINNNLIVDQINQSVLNNKGIPLNENLVAYPVAKVLNDTELKTDYYLFKKEQNGTGEKQIFMGVFTKDEIGEKNGANLKIPAIINQKNDLNLDLKMKDIFGTNGAKVDSFFLQDKMGEKNLNSVKLEDGKFEIKNVTLLNRENSFTLNSADDKIKANKFVGFEDSTKNNEILISKNQVQFVKVKEETQKLNLTQNTPILTTESFLKDKREVDLSKNNISTFNNDKMKLDFLKNKDSNEDAFFSFMSSDQENQTKENKKETGDKSSLEGKPILFEKSISSQVNSPIVVSDKSNADFSNSMVSAATRRAVDLSSQMQARGGGNAKIQIQDEKLGSLELNIHMKKDNTVSMEIKATDNDVKNMLEKNSDTLKKTLDSQNISLTDFKVTTVEGKSIHSGLGGTAGQGFSQQQSNQNSNNGNTQDLYQQNLNQGFFSNGFSNGNNPFFKSADDDYSFSNSSKQNYINNRNNLSRSMEKNSITNIQRGANGSIKVNV